MEKQNNRGTLSDRHKPTVLPSSTTSPRLCRSRSGSSTASITTPEDSSRRFGSSQRFANNGNRSKSTSKSRRTHNNEEHINPTSISSMPKKSQESSRDGFGKFLQRGVSPDSVGASKRATSAANSPSAWALSPGRFLGSPMESESPGKFKAGLGGSGGGVSKVWNYFKQKKVSSVQEEYHRFRILYNRSLQLRFVNARAEVAMANVEKAAEITLFSVWLRILMLRKTIIEKKMEMQKLKNRIKLYQMIGAQLSLLNEWAKLERKNEEYVSRLGRKLSALSIKLPLIHGLKADVESVHQAMKAAIEVMESIIEPLIKKYQRQVQRILYRITELTAVSKQQEEYLQELLRIIPMIATSVENEKSIRVHLIQTMMELKRGQHFCIGQSCNRRSLISCMQGTNIFL